MRVLGLAAAGAMVLATTASADYSTDWSGGAGGWVGSGDTATAFTLTAGTWFAPNSDLISSDFLTSPTFVVEDAGSLAFEFTHYYDMENGDWIDALARYNGSYGRRIYAEKVLTRLQSRWFRQ